MVKAIRMIGSGAVVALMTSAVAGCGTSTPASAEPILNVIMLQGSATTTLEHMVPQFEKKYHIHVNITAAPYNAMHEKEVENFESHSDRYDVMETDNPWLGEYAPAGWELNLGPSLKKFGYPVTSHDHGQTLQLDGMITPVLNDYGNYHGKLYGLPWMPGAQLLYYRKDLFDSPASQAAFKKEFGYALTVPKTLTQLYDVAKFFTDPSKGMYGLTWSAKQGNEAENDYEEILWAMGGDIFPFGQGFPSKSNPEQNMPVIDSAIGVKALNYFDSLKPFMPPGASGFHWAEITPEYTTGHAAMMIQWSDFVSQVASSRYKTDTGFALLPGDPSAPAKNIPHIVPGNGYSSLGGWVLAVNSDTKHPNSAVKFALWATGLKMTPGQRLHYENAAFTGFGFTSSYTNPATLGYKLGRFPVELETYKHYVRRRPDVGAGLQVQTIIGDQVNEAFTGQASVHTALQGMTTELFDEMQNKGYIPSSMSYHWPAKYVTREGTPR